MAKEAIDWLQRDNTLNVIAGTLSDFIRDKMYNLIDYCNIWIKNSNNFRLLFDYIFPIQRILSMLVIKDTLNFEQSKEGLPAHILEENEQFFKDAKKLLYSLIDEAAVTSRDPVLKSVISALAEDSVGDVARMIEKINSLS